MRVFFIGVCGTAMGNAAILLKKMGHQVAGSDSGVYPPMSDVLTSAGIELFEGFAEQEMLTWHPDRVVVGNAVSTNAVSTIANVWKQRGHNLTFLQRSTSAPK